MNDAALASAITSAGLSGAVVLLGNSDGVTFRKAYGQRDVASGDAMAVDSIFQIASMTKAITSVAALQLVEAGTLSLDAPIDDILPDLANPQVIMRFGDDGAPLLRPATRRITLRHLLTHTSGMGYDFGNATQARARGPAGSPPVGTRDGIKTPLLFDPGDAWEYGVSTDWVGQAVEVASGLRLDAYVEAHITGPLQMRDSGFAVSPEKASRRAGVVARNAVGGTKPYPVEIGGGPDAEILSGGGGMLSTADDYMRFLRMILNGGTLEGVRILKPETMALLLSNQVGALAAGKMGSVVPALALPYDPFPGLDCGWSLAFLINPEASPYGRAAGSLAWAGIANCHYWIDPANDMIGIFLTQLLPFADPQALAAFRAFEVMAYSGH